MASSEPHAHDYERQGLTADTFLTQNSDMASPYSTENSHDIEAAPTQPPVSSCEAPGEAKMISTQSVAGSILLGFSTGIVFGIARKLLPCKKKKK